MVASNGVQCPPYATSQDLLSKVDIFTDFSGKFSFTIFLRKLWKISTFPSTACIISDQSWDCNCFSNLAKLDIGKCLVFILFFFLVMAYFWLERGAMTTIVWSVSALSLSWSTCRGGRVLGGWKKEWRLDRMISRVELFLVGRENNLWSVPYESRILIMLSQLKSPLSIKFTSLSYLLTSFLFLRCVQL